MMHRCIYIYGCCCIFWRFLNEGSAYAWRSFVYSLSDTLGWHYRLRSSSCLFQCQVFSLLTLSRLILSRMS